jgi:hypothetical protein
VQGLVQVMVVLQDFRQLNKLTEAFLAGTVQVKDQS